MGMVGFHAGRQLAAPHDPGHSGRPAAKISTATQSAAEAQQAGALKITTSEGDVVTISFAGLQQSQWDTYQATSPQGTAAGSTATSSSAMYVGVKVEGSLSDKEMTEIGTLMEHLGAAVNDAQAGDGSKLAADLTATRSLGSVQSFQFAYQESARSEYRSTTTAVM